ncbi:NUDIX hydrolase [Acidibrevibacterium fodinaquatile]|uniref:NUDIX hydrolase n=1 Tax=Acidibrevibacterium fodinaquatile TaxID=1969806 RepID=UPI0013B36A16|nr:NUDIX hydrolase [Acidibrevibacterium fodinaquatile]
MTEEFVGSINEKFAGQAKIIHMLKSEPTLKRKGSLSLSEEERYASDLIKNSIENLFEPVTKYGVLSQSSLSNNKDESSVLEYYDTNYAEICAKRRTALKKKSIDDLPKVISACVVLFSKQKKTLYVHRRGERSVTYPGHLHTYGGHFKPAPEWGAHDIDSLLMTAVHQLQEEAGLHVSPLQKVPLMVSEETPTGFVQLVLLGVDIGEMGFVGPQLEGEAEGISFADLEGKLKPANWVPSGLMQILVWLALGAPGTDEKDWKQKPKDIFENAIKKVTPNYPWEQPRISYDPMGIEIEFKERTIEGEAKNSVIWNIGRPDCRFEEERHKGWEIRHNVIQKTEKIEEAHNITKSGYSNKSKDSIPSRTVIDAFKSVRKRFLAKHYSDNKWREKLIEKLNSEWGRANSTNSDNLKTLLIRSAAIMLTLSKLYLKNKNDTNMFYKICAIINHKDKIKNLCSYYENIYRIDVNQGRIRGRIKTPSLHPLFLYSPVVLIRLLEETITTGQRLIYTPSMKNPILWDL